VKRVGGVFCTISSSSGTSELSLFGLKRPAAIMYVMLSDILCECQVKYCRPMCELPVDTVTESKKKCISSNCVLVKVNKLPLVSCVSTVYEH